MKDERKPVLVSATERKRRADERQTKVHRSRRFESRSKQIGKRNDAFDYPKQTNVLTRTHKGKFRCVRQQTAILTRIKRTRELRSRRHSFFRTPSGIKNHA